MADFMGELHGDRTLAMECTQSIFSQADIGDLRKSISSIKRQLKLEEDMPDILKDQTTIDVDNVDEDDDIDDLKVFRTRYGRISKLPDWYKFG